jgi:hypothetical protein
LLKLPDVTLATVEIRNHELANLAVRECLAHADFGEVLVVTDDPKQFPGLPCLRVERWDTALDWARCLWFKVPEAIRTSHMLFMQWDSWIIDPAMWTDRFLRYDYIGAPWWHPEMNVGNGGFSLRSRRLIDYIAANADWYPTAAIGEDDVLCRTYRPMLEQQGFRWPPDAIGFDWAFECVRPSPQSRHFGFHAMFNWRSVMPEDKLFERLDIAARCPHVASNLQNFLRGNPDIAARLRA